MFLVFLHAFSLFWVRWSHITITWARVYKLKWWASLWIQYSWCWCEFSILVLCFFRQFWKPSVPSAYTSRKPARQLFWRTADLHWPWHQPSDVLNHGDFQELFCSNQTWTFLTRSILQLSYLPSGDAVFHHYYPFECALCPQTFSLSRFLYLVWGSKTSFRFVLGWYSPMNCYHY